MAKCNQMTPLHFKGYNQTATITDRYNNKY